jgi:pyruvate formate-lyase/glycerol dehydratase family glycyl radical enzyme
MVNNYLEKNERVQIIRERFKGLAPAWCTERGFLMTESYKETEGEPAVLRRAKALKKILDEMTVYIDDGELLVGASTSKRRGCMMLPEIQWEFYLNDMETLSTREWDKCLPLSDEEKRKMREFLPYWKGKALNDIWRLAVPEQSLYLQSHSLFMPNAGSNSGYYLAHVGVDYSKVLNKGLICIKKEVDEELGKIKISEINDFEKFQFLNAVNISLEAAINFSGRYAKLAENMAEKETDIQRKAELKKIAEICKRVPANPARNFHEALQSVWFINVVQRVEGFGPGITFGRPDQYLYPFYKHDKEAGIITDDQVQELLALFLLKINDLAALTSSLFVEVFAGFPTTANLTIGGVTPEGKDGVNELSYFFLDAEKVVGLTAEEFVIRVSKFNSDAFLMKACEVAKLLKGKFKFVSDDTAINQLLNDGKPIKYARDYILAGCFIPTVPVYTYDTTASSINLTLMLELALNNGVSRLTGEQLGPKTGDPKIFKTYDEVWNAYKKQVESVFPFGIIATIIDRKLFAELRQVPFQSALYNGAIQRGMDIMKGSTELYMTETHGVCGIPNVGDSLAAIKASVFDKKLITMKQLIEALDKNFVGEDEVLHILKNTPKFGNDDDYVDSITNDVIVHAHGEVSKYLGINGIKNTLCAATVTGHLLMGRLVGATPDGRKSGDPLAEGGISPHQGRNISGPTAAMIKLSGGSVFNMRFSPDVVSNELKMKKFVSLLRAYCESGGYHVQFNFVDADMLRDAQHNPEKYRDLLVRVATYSAYFVELSPRLQDDIITRTEFENI